MNMMPAEGENGIEYELLPEAWRQYTPADVVAAWGVNPSDLPDFWSKICRLFLYSTYAGFSKSCSAADVDYQKQRFLIHRTNALDITRCLWRGENAQDGVPIRVYLEDGTYYPLLFKQRCDDKYVITHRRPPEMRRWSHVCYVMGLQRRDLVRMWVYRHLRSFELCICTAKQVREG